MKDAKLVSRYKEMLAAARATPQGPDFDKIARDLAEESGRSVAEVNDVIDAHVITLGAG